MTTDLPNDKVEALRLQAAESFERWWPTAGFAHATKPEARAAWIVAKLEALQSARREIPAELFDGMAVYVAFGENSGVSPRDVAAVLDVVVRLIRKGRP